MIQTILNKPYYLVQNKLKPSKTRLQKKTLFNNNDVFIKTQFNPLISFRQNLEIEKKKLRNLQNEYLNLQFPVKLVPQKLFNSNGYIIHKALVAGEAIEDIIINHWNELKDHEEVQLVMNSKIDGKPVKEILADFKVFWDKRQALLAEIYPLQTSLDLDYIKPKISQKNEKDYIKFCIASSEKDRWNLLWSDSIRYIDLYRPVNKLINKKVNNNKSFIDTTLKNDKSTNKVNFFVAGLGARYEEVYDYSLYSLNSLEDKNLKLSDAIDFEMVDFRSAEQLNISYINPPKVVSLSFFKDPDNLNDSLIEHPSLDTLGFKTYPVEVLDYVANTIEESKKLHTSTTLEEFAENYKGPGYDFVSVNNIMQYPGYGDVDTQDSLVNLTASSRFLNPFRSSKPLDSQEFNGYKAFLANILEMVKPGGYLSCKIDGMKTQGQAYNEIMDNLISVVDTNKDFLRMQQGLYIRKECDK